MAKIVAGFGSSHSVMLMSTREDWQKGFRLIDPHNRFYFDCKGNPTTYKELLEKSQCQSKDLVSDEVIGQRYDQCERAMVELHDRISAAKLDVLVIIGDDQSELFSTTHNPSIAIYYGETIRNAKRVIEHTFNFFDHARSMRQEPNCDVLYPVHSHMAQWLISDLCEHEFDVSAMSGLESGQFEGHAFSFIHRRYLQLTKLPIIPVLINTFDPPNQPTPHRCVAFGRALADAIERYPQNIRVGILASGGLSHFIVQEDLDQRVLNAIRNKDSQSLAALDPNEIKAGSSEIRNWIIAAEALGQLDLDWVSYIPAYRSEALTGTGLAFAAWRTLT